MFKDIDARWLPYLNVDDVCEKVDERTESHYSHTLDAFKHTPYKKLKVVIVGRDPYPTSDDTCRLVFSTSDKPISKSMGIIYDCLINTGVIRDYPNTSDMSNWAYQGVLVLNKPHSDTECKYIDDIIKKISNNYPNNIHFMVWDNCDKSILRLINSDRHSVSMCSYPSPAMQQYITDDQHKFINYDGFKRVNNYLYSEGRRQINWNPDPVKLHYNIKHNGLNDVRSLTTWVATYKYEGRVFIGGVVPFNVSATEMIYHDKEYAIKWIEKQAFRVNRAKYNKMLSNSKRIVLYHSNIPKNARPGETYIFN